MGAELGNFEELFQNAIAERPTHRLLDHWRDAGVAMHFLLSGSDVKAGTSQGVAAPGRGIG